MKKGFFFIPLLASSLACNSQPSQTIALNPNKVTTITGVSKTPVSGKGIVYLELLSDRGIASKVDSSVAKDGKFSFKTTIAEPNFYQINIPDQQHVILILDGGETLNVEAEGKSSDDKMMGVSTVTGSKGMDAFQTINKMTADMQLKVGSLQTQYQAASAKKNQAEMQAIQKKFEVEQSAIVERVKVMIPTMGSSLTALYATNFLNLDKDFEIFDQLVTNLEAAGAKYPMAKTFINMVKAKKGVSLGGDAPDFTLTDLEGKTTKLSDLKGKVVILDFWATWCRPCLMSFPGMRKAMDKYKANDNVKFFFVDTFERVGPDAVKGHITNFVAGRGDEMKAMQILLDKDSGVAQSFNVSGIPAKFCIDKNGKLFKKSEGFMGSDDLIVEEIDKWVAEANK